MNKAGQIKEEAVVLRSIRHSETSRIITLFGRTLGKFAVIAKGVRRSKSSSSGSGLEPPARVEALVYYKPSRSVQNLGATTVLDGYSGIKSDLALTGYAAVILEQVNRVYIDDEPNEDGYLIIADMLSRLDKNKGNPRITLWQFQLNMLRAIGFELDPFPCPVCGAKISDIGRHNLLLMDEGAICCQSCSPNNASSASEFRENNRFSLSGESVSLLRRMSNGHSSSLIRITPSQAARDELTRALEMFLRFHNPSIGKLPALRMLDQLE